MKLPGTTLVAGVPRRGSAMTPVYAAAGPAGFAGSADPASGRDLEVAAMLRLYRDEGLSLRDTAVAVGCGPDTVRARLLAAGVAIRMRPFTVMPEPS